MNRENVPGTMDSARVALTDRRWFDHLAGMAAQRAGVASDSRIVRLDEVNFWQPRGPRQPRMGPGEPFFLRHHKDDGASIAGFGFFATWHRLTIAEAWRVFGTLNGAPTYEAFVAAILSRRPSSPDTIGSELIGCIVLRDVHFLPSALWQPWQADMEWKPNTQVSKSYGLTGPAGTRLMSLLRMQSPDLYTEIAAEFSDDFQPFSEDERRRQQREFAVRDGQRSFRLRLLKAYEGQCALTGEHTEPVLEAAHIQDYLGPRSNHLQNGLLLRADIHDLYDQGYLTVVPRKPSGSPLVTSANELVIRISRRIDQWNNGKIYKKLDGQPPRKLPTRGRDMPSRAALVWHAEHTFS